MRNHAEVGVEMTGHHRANRKKRGKLRHEQGPGMEQVASKKRKWG